MNVSPSKCCHFCCLSYANCSLPVEQVWFLYNTQWNATCSLMACFLINSRRCVCPVSTASSNWWPVGVVPRLWGRGHQLSHVWLFFYIYICMYLLSCYLYRWMAGGGATLCCCHLLPYSGVLLTWARALLRPASALFDPNSASLLSLLIGLTFFFFFFFFRNILKCTVLLFKECYCH